MSASAPAPHVRVARGLKPAPHRYGLVLLIALFQFLLLSAGGEGLWVRVTGALVGALLLVVVYVTSGVERRLRHLAILVAAAGGLIAVISVPVGGDDFTRAMSGLVGAALIAGAGTTVLRGLTQQPIVNRQSVFGAVSVYLLLGIFFAYLFASIAALSDQPFFAAGQSETLAHFLYFSFATMTTVGFGDFTAATNLGHTLAIVEAVAGQIYLITIVGLVVAHLGTPRTPRERARGDEGSWEEARP